MANIEESITNEENKENINPKKNMINIKNIIKNIRKNIIIKILKVGKKYVNVVYHMTYSESKNI